MHLALPRRSARILGILGLSTVLGPALIATAGPASAAEVVCMEYGQPTAWTDGNGVTTVVAPSCIRTYTIPGIGEGGSLPDPPDGPSIPTGPEPGDTDVPSCTDLATQIPAADDAMNLAWISRDATVLALKSERETLKSKVDAATTATGTQAAAEQARLDANALLIELADESGENTGGRPTPRYRAAVAAFNATTTALVAADQALAGAKAEVRQQQTAVDNAQNRVNNFTRITWSWHRLLNNLQQAAADGNCP